VGRDHDLAELRSALREAVDGRGSLVLLAGEPGIGKTRLAEQVATDTAPGDAMLLWGSAWEGDGAPPFWPWIQVLRQLLRQLPAADRDTLFDHGEPLLGEMANMLPELMRPIPAAAELAALPPEQARFRLFDAIATLLVRASQMRPLLLVLDDLHWADVPSLRLLRFLARELYSVRLLLLGAYRDVEAGPASPIEELAGALGGACYQIVLRGLGPDEVARLIAVTTGTAPDLALAAQVRERTGGNPLFVREMARLLAAGLTGAAVPDGVRPVLARRLDLLSAPCAELLAVASVLGHDLRLELLEVLAETSAEQVLELLGEAVRARLVEEVPSSPLQWRFAHALVREVLYERLPPARRLALHRRAGEAMEVRFAGALEPRLEELADHFLRAGPDGAAKAVDYSARAGQRALSLLAYEDAVGCFQRALRAQDLAAQGPVPDHARRCELELALAEARMAAGEVALARDGFERTAGLARRLGDGKLLARAALGLGEDEAVFAIDELQVRLLEEALELVEGDSALRARLLARLARAPRRTSAPAGSKGDRRLDLSDEAVTIATRLDDPATLAAVLLDRHAATWGVGGPSQQLATATQIVQLAEAAGDQVLAAHGHHLRILDFLEAGDAAAMRAEADTFQRIVGELRDPPHLRWPVLMVRGCIALMDGRFDQTEQLASQARAVGRRAGDPAAAPCALGLRSGHYLVSGRPTADLEGAYHKALTLNPLFVWRALLTVMLTNAGRTAEAREEFERLAAGGFAGLPRPTTPVYLISAAVAAMAAYGLGDAERADVLSALLRPYAGQMVRAIRVGGGFCWPVSHHLGLLAATTGRWDDAVEQFAAAVDSCERMAAPPYLAHSRYYYAKALAAKGRPGDQDRAARELEAAHALLRRFGIRPLFAHDDPDLRLELWPGAPGAAPSAGPAPGTGAPTTSGKDRHGDDGQVAGVLRCEGDYWTVGWRGSAVRLRGSIGMAYLARLLAVPGREFHALDLAGTGASTGTGAGVAAGAAFAAADPATAAPLVDAQAKAAYRRRLKELAEEVAEAEAWNDLVRAERARTEAQQLAAHLAAVTGLAGRDRQARANAERARISVTKALRTAIGRIAAHQPALGEHLQRSVRTGSFCAYDPDPSIPVTWTLG